MPLGSPRPQGEGRSLVTLGGLLSENSTGAFAGHALLEGRAMPRVPWWPGRSQPGVPATPCRAALGCSVPSAGQDQALQNLYLMLSDDSHHSETYLDSVVFACIFFSKIQLDPSLTELNLNRTNFDYLNSLFHSIWSFKLL